MEDNTIKQPNGYRVLVIEDDPDMATLISSILSGAGYNTLVAFSGEDGIEKVRDSNPDLVLLDIMLPRMDGIEVCRSLAASKSTSRIPVIMVTVKSELSSKLSSYVAGAKRYLTKPFSQEELLNIVKLSLRQTHIPDASGRIRLDMPTDQL